MPPRPPPDASSCHRPASHILPPYRMSTAPQKIPTPLSAKHDRLREEIAGYGSALVCFSGGVDSTLLLRVAHDVLGDRCLALTTVSVTMAGSERRAAVELAARIGARLEVVESHELERAGFAANR